MTFFVIQVRTGAEEKVMRQAARMLDGDNVRLIWPRRNLRIRKRGVWRDSKASIFPGYLFLQAEAIEADIYLVVKRIPGFFRFLKDNQHIEPISLRDRELLLHFLSFGEVVERSKVCFDENQRIRVLSGPLKDLEGRIVKVNRRKGRAKIRLELYNDNFLIDFGFDVLEAYPRQAEPVSESG